MTRRSPLRVVLALTFAISSLVVMAAPAAAATTIIDCEGYCGYWDLSDVSGGPAGAVCAYETASYDLDSISIRPPLIHGAYPSKTKVDWRFKVRRAADISGPYSTIKTGKWQSAKANNSAPAYAGHGFARQTWHAPENPQGYYVIWVELRWHGLNGDVEGTARAEYDSYKLTWTNRSFFVDDACFEVIL